MATSKPEEVCGVEVQRQTVVASGRDAAARLFREAFPQGELYVPDVEGFRYTLGRAAFGGTAVVDQWFGGRVRLQSAGSDSVAVVWSERGSVRWLRGKQTFAADDGVLWSGRGSIGAEIDQAQMGSILIDRGDFEARAGRLLGAETFRLPEFTVLPSVAHGAVARRHFRALEEHQLQEQAEGSALVQHAGVDLTVAVVLAAADLDQRPQRLTGSRSVRRALGYIDEHLDRPMAVSDIAAAAGLSARGLEGAFRRDVGETPMQRLRRLRLARVRAELVTADPQLHDVATIARRWGFTHLGRFASVYRQAYDELPSQTLRR